MRHQALFRRRTGFSLVEVMLALAVLAFGLGGIVEAFLSQQRGTTMARERLAAETLASRRAQELKAAGCVALKKHMPRGAQKAVYPARAVTESLLSGGASGAGPECQWQAELEQIEQSPICIRVRVNVQWKSPSAGLRRVSERTHVYE